MTKHHIICQNGAIYWQECETKFCVLLVKKDLCTIVLLRNYKLQSLHLLYTDYSPVTMCDISLWAEARPRSVGKPQSIIKSYIHHKSAR